MAIKKENIEATPRYYRQNAAYAIRDIYDALVEIVTNSDDSYHKLYINQKRSEDGGDILIEIDRKRGRPSTVTVKDKAEGMTYDVMRDKLRHMGKYSGSTESRGFMGRGLRDCCILGAITVESVVDGKYYACRIEDFVIEYHNGKLQGEVVTESQRKRLGINKNGTVIGLQLNSKAKLPHFDTLVKNLPLHYALRKMVSPDSDTTILIRKKGERQTKTLSMSTIEGEKVFDEVLRIGSDSEPCRLQIYKAPRPLGEYDPRMRKFGIITTSKRTVHQCSLYGYDNVDMAKYYFGEVECDYIQKAMEESDSNQEMVGVIDPNRQAGLNQSHPFVKELDKKIKGVLKTLLEADEAETTKSGDVANQNTRDKLSKLAKLASLYLSRQVGETDLPITDENAIKGTQRRGIEIVPPRFNVRVGETRSLSVYVKKDLYQPNNKLKIETENEKIIAVARTAQLKPHSADESILYGTFKVLGIALDMSAKITARLNKKVSAESFGTVVKERDDERYFTDELEFEYKRCKITEGKTRKIKIFAERSVLSSQNSTVIISSADDTAVVVKGGGRCELKSHEGKNYWQGEIEIEGRNVTARAVTVTARVPQSVRKLEASTKVRVVESEGVEGGFDFQIVDDDIGGRAQWRISSQEFGNDESNVLLISAIHPSIKQYFGDPPDFPLQKEPQCQTLLAEIITEMVCLRILRREMQVNQGSFVFSDKEPWVVLDEINAQLRKKVNDFSVQAHKIMQSA